MISDKMKLIDPQSSAHAADESDVPEHFYKYRPLSTDEDFEKLEKLLISNQLWFSSPASFNDPFDCKAVFDFSASKDEMKQDYARLSKKFDPALNRAERRADTRRMMRDKTRNPRMPAVQRTIENEYHDRMNRVGVYCVSEINADVLMWAHYANAHTGICLEYDGLGKLMAHAQRVLYRKLRPRIPQFQPQDNVEALERGLLTKSLHWKYEKEWRLIRFEQGFGLATIHPESLTGIIIGAQTPPSIIERLRALLARREQPLKLYKAHVSRSDYELHVKKC